MYFIAGAFAFTTICSTACRTSIGAIVVGSGSAVSVSAGLASMPTGRRSSSSAMRLASGAS